MKRIFFTAAACLMMTAAYAQSSKQNFDFGWKFSEGDATEAYAETFDDSGWQSVVLPHDWDIFHAPAADGATANGGGFYPGGIGWYRKAFSYSGSGKAVLHFEGVYHFCTVYVNGKKAGQHGYGYTPFRIDITGLVRNGENTVAVRVDNSGQTNCRWYSGSGIYRHVWLENYAEGKMDDPEKLFIRTEKIYGMSSDGLHADSASVHVTYGDVLDEIRMFRDIDLWSTGQPALYDITVGELTVKHGFRTVTCDSENGLQINGQKVKIDGACLHHDNGILGAAAYDAAEIRKVRMMKAAGFNLLRTSHNPQSRAFMDACDSLGMLVLDEVFDGWYKQKNDHGYFEIIDSCYKEDIASFVLRDRNHPCVIFWSIGNEVVESNDIAIVKTAKKFRREILKYDATRPVTEAITANRHDWELNDPHTEVLDFTGYNYTIEFAKRDHELHPERYGLQTESLPRDAFSNWLISDTSSYILGDAVWTGLDYLGEAGIGQFYYEGEPAGEHWEGPHFPFHGAYCGDVDITGWRKPISHYRSILWNNDEKLYMAVKEPEYGKIKLTIWGVWPEWESWNWPGWEGKEITVEVFTKEPEVKLYLNDSLVGTAKSDISTGYKAVFPITYRPGTLRAEAGGESRILETTGKPASVRLTPDRRQISSDGQDIAFITLELVDSKGRIVTDSDMQLTVGVTGEGSFMAAGSASMKDIEPMTSDKVTTYKGRALIAVRSTRKAGSFTVSVQSALPASKLKIKTSE